jgi:hypothetical protein
MKHFEPSAIPKETALKLCTQISKENKGKWYSWAAWRCKGCVKWSRGDEGMLYFNTRLGLRGCGLVNSRYAKMSKKTN